MPLPEAVLENECVNWLPGGGYVCRGEGARERSACLKAGGSHEDAWLKENEEVCV